MTEEFRRIIESLWKSLGLASPNFRPEGTAALTVDGLNIRLALTDDDRHIAVSCRAGQLSANPTRINEQITRLLTSHLRTLPYNRACCWLDEQDSPTPVVVVQAITPCNQALMDRLVRTIGDVAHLAGEYSSELGGRAAEPRVRNERLPDDDMVIFRP